MKKNNLVIISGTTKGLGYYLKNCFSNENIVCLNRIKKTSFDIKIDLSQKNIDLVELKEKINQSERIVFISNASTIEPIRNICNINEKDIENSIYTNYVNPTKIILSIVKSKKEFVIINITTGAAFTINTKLAMYSASKASMHRFVEILKEEEEENTKALFIENFDPGRMQTNMQKNLLDAKKIKNDILEFKKPESVAIELYSLIGKYL